MATQQAFVAAHVPGMVTDVKEAVSVQVQTTPQVQPTPLPAGWLEMKDPAGRTIYINSANGTTSWQRPVVRQLPPGWIKTQTPDGKPMFVHPATQKCSFQWPGEPAKPTQPPQVSTVAAMPQMTRHTTTPAAPISQASLPGPRLVRSTTAPAKAPVKTQNPALMTMTVNTAVARKTIPGFDEALAIHQLSERNNTQVLGKKLGADMAHASVALKDTTITAASLATRQAKAVGQTMVSATKMQKVSKKAIVHTGALGVKIGRASKNLMHEMVDAADGKGKYKPKVRAFVPQDPLPATPPQKHTLNPDAVHAYEYQQATSTASAQQLSQAMVPAKPVNTGVPVRKPLKRPSVSVSSMQSVPSQISVQPLATVSASNQVEQSTGSCVENEEVAPTTQVVQQLPASSTTTGKPPRPAIDINASLEISAQGSVALNLPGSTNRPPLQPAVTSANPVTNTITPQQQQQVQQQALSSLPQPTLMTQNQQPATAAPASLVIQTDANATLTFQHQAPANQPPPPYSPQLQRPPNLRPSRPVSTTQNQTSQYSYSIGSPSPAQQQMQTVQPVQQFQYYFQDSAAHQQQQQPILIQQPSQPSTADAYLQASEMMALQQQMQALQMQQQLQQIQGLQQQQLQAPQQEEVYVLEQPQDMPQQSQDAVMNGNIVAGQDGDYYDYYYVDDSTNNVTVDGGDMYQQQQSMCYDSTDAGVGVVGGSSSDIAGGAIYAQETTVEMYGSPDGDVVYVEEQTVVYEEGYDAVGGDQGDVVYAEAQEMQVYEVDAGDGAVVDEVDECGEVEVECECEC